MKTKIQVKFSLNQIGLHIMAKEEGNSYQSVTIIPTSRFPKGQPCNAKAVAYDWVMGKVAQGFDITQIKMAGF